MRAHSPAGARIHTLLGGVGTVLNVTSQKWLDVSRARGPYGAVWTHHVVVIVPKHVRVRNVSLVSAAGAPLAAVGFAVPRAPALPRHDVHGPRCPSA